MVTLNPASGQIQPKPSVSSPSRSALPLAAADTAQNAEVQFGASGKTSKAARIGGLAAAIAIGTAALGGLAGCSSGPDESEAVPGVSIQIDNKTTPVTPVLYSDGIVVNQNNNQVLGHFDESGEAYIGDTQIAMTSDGDSDNTAKIFGLIKDDQGAQRAIQIGNVDANGKVTDMQGVEKGVIEADNSVISPKEKGAIAALTMFAVDNDTLSKNHYGGDSSQHAPASASDPTGNFWFWMWMMNSNRSPVIVQRVNYPSYNSYRTQYNSRLDSNWRNSPAGTKIGSYGDKSAGNLNKGGFGDATHVSGSGGKGGVSGGG